MENAFVGKKKSNKKGASIEAPFLMRNSEFGMRNDIAS
jgi:hypothetical protein